MSAPALRVALATVSDTRASHWLNALRPQLPAVVECLRWSTQIGPADLVLLLAGTDAESTEEARLRDALTAHAQSYQVVAADADLQQALHAIGQRLSSRHPALARPLLRAEMPPRWQGVCETCSDPDCEHRLFSRLTAP